MENLRHEDWAFHELPDQRLELAWFWESARELVGRGRPFALLSEFNRDWLMRGAIREGAIQPAFEVIEAEPTAPDTAEWFASQAQALKDTPLDIVVCKIDRSKSSFAVTKEAGEWLDSHPSEKTNKAWPGWERGPGRKKDYKAMLVDLAICRTVKLGLPRIEVIKRFTPLLDWTKIGGSKDCKFSSSHWNNAVLKTEHRLGCLNRKITNLKLSIIIDRAERYESLSKELGTSGDSVMLKVLEEAIARNAAFIPVVLKFPSEVAGRACQDYLAAENKKQRAEALSRMPDDFIEAIVQVVISGRLRGDLDTS